MDFISALEHKGEQVEIRSGIEQSVESHLMAYAAEQARLTDTVILMKDIR